MKNSAEIVAAGFMALVFSSIVSVTNAAEIKVFSGRATRAIVEDLGTKFEKASGHKVASSFMDVSETLTRIKGGEIPDVVFNNQEGIDRLVKDGKVVADSVTVIARSGLGVAVGKGVPKPDISSPEALKRALLAAKSITYNDPKNGGASGTHIAKVLERLGIAKEVKSKTIYSKNDAGELVAAGKAGLGMTQISSLVSVAGIEIVGPLPGDLQANIIYSAAITTGAKNAAAAKALVNFLRTPESAKVITAMGMDPG
jgi:molybdate transport system substrate-binding protein